MTVQWLFPGFLLLFSWSTSAKNEPITVKSSSVNNEVMITEVYLNGNPVELQCSINDTSCTHLTAGDYLMVRLQSGGQYQDCQNVHIYAKNGSPKKDKPLGEYCLLQP